MQSSLNMWSSTFPVTHRFDNAQSDRIGSTLTWMHKVLRFSVVYMTTTSLFWGNFCSVIGESITLLLLWRDERGIHVSDSTLVIISNHSSPLWAEVLSRGLSNDSIPAVFLHHETPGMEVLLLILGDMKI